jgi:hypothetical protein
MSEMNTEPVRLAQELGTTLSALERALADAGTALSNAGNALTVASNAATQVRGQASQLETLAEIVSDLEATIMRARGGLAPSSAQGAAPALRAVPPATYDSPAAIEPEDVSGQNEPATEYNEAPSQAEAPEIQETSIGEEPSGGSLSHCLLLGVTSKNGSLDLKAVDGSVNENPAVVDVALLDYDGRQATLKLWINNQADPQSVREALLASLQRRLGEDDDAEVQIEFEDSAA